LKILLRFDWFNLNQRAMEQVQLRVISESEFQSIKVTLERISDKLDGMLSQKSLNDQRLSQKAAALHLGITEATIIDWKKKKKITYYQAPNSSKVWYYKSELDQILQQNKHLLKK
jgi:hypothetical protein